MDKEVLDVSALVSLRKNELYKSILDEIREDEEFSDQEKEKLKVLISKMDFEEFLTEKELKTKTLHTDNDLSDLDLDRKKILESLDIELEE